MHKHTSIPTGADLGERRMNYFWLCSFSTSSNLFVWRKKNISCCWMETELKPWWCSQWCAVALLLQAGCGEPASSCVTPHNITYCEEMFAHLLVFNNSPVSATNHFHFSFGINTWREMCWRGQMHIPIWTHGHVHIYIETSVHMIIKWASSCGVQQIAPFSSIDQGLHWVEKSSEYGEWRSVCGGCSHWGSSVVHVSASVNKKTVRLILWSIHTINKVPAQ